MGCSADVRDWLVVLKVFVVNWSIALYFLKAYIVSTFLQGREGCRFHSVASNPIQRRRKIIKAVRVH